MNTGKIQMIRCPACEKELSEQAIQCPGCGHPINGHSEVYNELVKLKARVDALERRITAETPLYVTER